MTWRPLEPARVIRNPKREEAILRHARAHAKATGKPFDEARCRAILDEEASLPIWKSLDYQVAVRRWIEAGTPFFHLSIKRIDKRPLRDWRDLQRIKNQLVGEEVEAVEIFPAESRLTDTANQYHLWGVEDPEFRFPFGWDSGRTVDDTASEETGVGQRPFEKPT